MKTIGLIGGTTWISSLEYYRLINEKVNKLLGNSNSAKCVMYSVNFEEILELGKNGRWNNITSMMIKIAQKLEKFGADCVILCANTMHIVAGPVQQNINIPLIHIADETAKCIKQQRITKVGLLGTKLTMEENFYKDRLLNYAIDAIVPDENDRDYIQHSIVNELGKNIISKKTKERFLAIIDDLNNKGAEGLILGCTEIPFLIKQDDCKIPVFDTLKIHSDSAVEFAVKCG